MSQAAVRLRTHPYPYRSGLAICSDLDRCSFDDFVALHLFLNTKGPTPLGEGLGLEIGDSFWMYSAGSRTDDSFSYFKGTSRLPSEHAEFIREGIAAGYLDCLHTYGHFTQFGGFSRVMAEDAIEELARYNLQVAVWTNHGDIHNLQNISTGLGDLPVDIQASGDRTPVEEYHTDITLKLGVRFAWTGEITGVIGQDRPYLPIEAFRNVRRRLGRKAALRASLAAAVDRLAGPTIYKGVADRNDLFSGIMLRDGATMLTFRRFLPDMCWGRDWSEDLARSLSIKILDLLEKRGGLTIIYVHLGKKRGGELLSSESVAGLRDLQRRSEDGKVWVSATARLLTYSWIHRYLSWHHQEQSGNCVITLECVADPVGGRQPVSPRDCEGLTWYTPVPERTTVVLSSGEELPVVQNPADERGLRSVSLPIKPLDATGWLASYRPKQNAN